MEKFQTEGRGRRSEYEDVSHQRKSKKMKHTKTESSSSSEVFGEQRNYHTTSDSSDDNLYTKMRKYKPYEEIVLVLSLFVINRNIHFSSITCV